MPLEGEVTLSKLTNGSLQRIERGREETPTVFCLDFLGRLVVVESVTLPARCDLLLFVATFSSQTASELYTLLLVLLQERIEKEREKCDWTRRVSPEGQCFDHSVSHYE